MAADRDEGAAVQELGGRAGAKTSLGCQCGARWWASAVGCLGEASRGLPNEDDAGDDAVLSVVEGHRHDVRVQPARDERTRLRRMGMGARVSGMARGISVESRWNLGQPFKRCDMRARETAEQFPLGSLRHRSSGTRVSMSSSRLTVSLKN